MPSYTGTAGADTLAGSTAADLLTGAGGNDTYLVNHLGDRIVESGGTGGGIDTIRTSVLDALGTYSLAPWSAVENLVYAGNQAARLVGNALGNALRASSTAATADTLSGGGGHDSLHGFAGDDSLLGGDGNDRLDGGTGNDVLAGGAGDDRYYVDSLADRIVESVKGGFDTIQSAVWTDLRLAGARQVEGLAYTGTAAASLHGNAMANALTSQSTGNDTLEGHEGNDTLSGGGGADVLRGGTGNDFYLVGAGDVVEEQEGEGIDTLQGTRTSLATSAFATTIENLLYTGAAAASLVGNALDNLMAGSTGNDTLSGAGGADSLVGGTGSDSLVGGDGDDLLYGGGLRGTTIASGRVADASTDRLVGGAGNDRYWIEDGLDRAIEAASGGTFDVIYATADASLAHHAYVEALVLQGGAWLAQGSTGNDVLVGHQGGNHLEGGAGADTLSGQSDVATAGGTQSDVVDGGSGSDVLLAVDFAGGTQAREALLLGGAGNDLYVLGTDTGNCSGFDSGGADTALLLESGSIEAIDGVENVYLRGASASLDARAQEAIARVYTALHPGGTFGGSFSAAADATGNALANRIVGNALDNALRGEEGDDTLIGAEGGDTLTGGAGTDSLVGGLGDDEYFLEAGDVATELEGQGYDVLNSASITTLDGLLHIEGLRYLGSASVNLHRGAANTSDDLLAGGSGHDTVRGHGGADTLSGGAGNDTVDGGAGQDHVQGGAGNDVLLGGSDDDTLEGGDGADDLQGGDGVDLQDGGTGNDTLQGGTSDDILAGGSGNDLLHGGGSGGGGGGTVTAGDVLWGDAVGGGGARGSDTFYLDQAGAENALRETFPGSGEFVYLNATTIADFQSGSDRIALPATLVGDGDTMIEAIAVQESPGGSFSAGAELVLVRSDVATSFVASAGDRFSAISATAIADVLGQGDSAMEVNAMKIIVVDDGASSAIFIFQSSDGNAEVTADEIYLVGVVSGQAALGAGDFTLLA